jgi:hypothetical protein
MYGHKNFNGVVYAVIVSFSFFLMLIVFSACNKTPEIHHYVPQLYKDLGVFYKNSYWIYKNETTHTLDSTYVFTDPGFFSYHDEGSTTDYILTYYGGGLIEQESIDNIQIIISSPVLHFSPSVFSNYTLLEKIDSMEVNGNKFRNVYHTRLPTVTSDSTPMVFNTYLVEHIGIIKITKTINQTDTTISLIRYNVKY